MFQTPNYLTRSARTAVIALFAMIVCVSTGSPQTVDPANAGNESQGSFAAHKLSLSFGGLLMSGRVETAVLPTSGDNYGDMNPMESPYGFGLGVDYNISPKMRIFLDGNVYSYRKQVGVAGELSESFWVYEMTDYSTHYLMFNDDAYFDMQTAGFRLGVKYDLPKGNLRPWFGAGIGLYSWKADYCTADRSKSWGSASGTVTGATFLLGGDFIVLKSAKHPVMLSLFGDFASPVVNPVIENLFLDGWTWENSGGNHVMGPYRFGLSIGFFL